MTSNSDVVGTPSSKALSTGYASSPDFVGALRASSLSVWTWLTRYSSRVLTRKVPRRLSVAETVSFGEKRFVSILRVDGEQFLVGGSPSNIVLLAKLEEKREVVEEGFESVVSRLEADAVGRRTGCNRSSEVAR
jgi:hypothetical protein